MANDSNEAEFWGTEPTTRRLPAIGRRRTTTTNPTVGRRQHTGPLPTVSVRRSASGQTPPPVAPRSSVDDDWDNWDNWDDDLWGATTGRGAGAYSAGTSASTGPIEVPVTRAPRTRAQAIDPLLKRVGAAVAAVALLIPIGASLFGDDSPSANLGARAATDGEANAPVATNAPTSTTMSDQAAEAANDAALNDVADESSAEKDSAQLAAAAQPAVNKPSVRSSRRTTTSTTVSRASAQGASASRATAATCSRTYRVKSGDFWISIARTKKVTLKSLLARNKATTKTVLHPGQVICLPKPNVAPSTSTSAPGTTAPTPSTKPVKTTTTTTQPKSTTTQPKSTTTTTQPKPTTTTTQPKPKTTYTKAEVMQIIRDVWPDSLEDKALAIAWRESNYVPTVRNYCCLGLFQIYWNVHKSWLLPLGVTEQGLYDPRINAMAALALYNRAGGWGPWAL